VQVFLCQVQQAAQSQYLAGTDCAQLLQTQLGKASCLLGEMEQLTKQVTEATFYKHNNDRDVHSTPYLM